MARGAVIPILTLLAATSSVQAQRASPTEAPLASRLVGPGSQDFIKTREYVFMGGDRCQSGERWRFASDGSLKVRICAGNTWSVSTHRWRIEDRAGKPVLAVAPPVSESGRRVLLTDDGSRLFLRRMPGTKTGGVETVELRLAKPTDF